MEYLPTLPADPDGNLGLGYPRLHTHRPKTKRHTDAELLGVVINLL